jgi:hypothetical protein
MIEYLVTDLRYASRDVLDAVQVSTEEFWIQMAHERSLGHCPGAPRPGLVRVQALSPKGKPDYVGIEWA